MLAQAQLTTEELAIIEARRTKEAAEVAEQRAQAEKHKALTVKNAENVRELVLKLHAADTNELLTFTLGTKTIKDDVLGNYEVLWSTVSFVYGDHTDKIEIKSHIVYSGSSWTRGRDKGLKYYMQSSTVTDLKQKWWKNPKSVIKFLQTFLDDREETIANNLKQISLEERALAELIAKHHPEATVTTETVWSHYGRNSSSKRDCIKVQTERGSVFFTYYLSGDEVKYSVYKTEMVEATRLHLKDYILGA